MCIDKQEIKDIINLATELHSIDSNKFSEIKGIMKGVLLFSEEKSKIKIKKESA